MSWMRALQRKRKLIQGICLTKGCRQIAAKGSKHCMEHHPHKQIDEHAARQKATIKAKAKSHHVKFR